MTSRLPALARLVPGLAICLAVTALAFLVAGIQRAASGQVLVEPLVVALLLGVIAGNLVPARTAIAPGTAFAARGLLEAAIVVLGLTLDAGQVLAAGAGLLALIGIAVGVALAAGYAIGRAVGLAPRLAFLVAAGNAICGNSAIAAIAPVIGASRQQVATAIALTAVLGVAMVLALPLLVPVIGLDHYRYGVVAGMSVYSVPQVVAASFPVSQLAGQVATLVKLVRVVLLGPLVVVAAIVAGRRAAPTARRDRAWTGYVPWFVVGFALLAVLRNAGLVPGPIVDGARDVTGLLMTISMAGLGYGVRLADVRAAGPRVTVAVLGSLACIVAVTLGLLVVLGVST